MPTLDPKDRKILEILQRDGRATQAAIAAEIGLTAPTVLDRIRKLEERGVIQGYTVQLDPQAVGKPLTAFIRLVASYDEKHDPGLKEIAKDPDVLEFYSVAGEDCFIIKTRVANPSELEALLHRIRQLVTVQRSVTMITLSAFKENGPLNLPEA